jgi:hypothetical protein
MSSASTPPRESSRRRSNEVPLMLRPEMPDGGLTPQHAFTKLGETSMRPTFTSAHAIGTADLSTRGLIVILLGILPR